MTHYPIIYICAYCGKEITEHKEHWDDNKPYCSSVCARKYCEEEEQDLADIERTRHQMSDYYNY